ncbi:MAG: ATP-dependent nuclease [Patescibacteria group bacterium]
MASIHQIKVSNFRGIKALDFTFVKSKFVCLVGRGDSCKSTILEALSYVLYPNWNLSVSDNDFYECNPSNAIEIEVTLRDLPEELLKDTKYGLYIRGIEQGGVNVINTLTDECEKALTVKLVIDQELEPKWYVISYRDGQDPIEIKHTDRALLNVYLLSDYLDRHFYYSKGSPLYQLSKNEGAGIDGNVLINAMRTLKEDVGKISGFERVIERVKTSALKFGVNVSGTTAGLDSRDISVKDSRIALHDAQTPFRQKGKGSRRLISIAIQSELANESIVLIDEIEQGLEPDRVKHLVRTVMSNGHNQVFCTTHSAQVIEELEPDNIFVVNNHDGVIEISHGFAKGTEHQRLMRLCPDSLYATNVILCEGKTEIGFCRAFEVYRKSKGFDSLASKGVVYSLGGGDGFNKLAKMLKTDFGKKVCIFCDSDKNSEIADPTKVELIKLGVNIFDWKEGNSFEKQLSEDLPWKGILELIAYVLNEKCCTYGPEQFIRETTGLDWKQDDTPQNREIFYLAATKKDKSWYKRIDHGEYIGNICFKYYDEISDTSNLKMVIEGLNKWVEDAS